MSDTKVCIECNIEKSIDEFYKVKNRNDTYSYRNKCKSCFNYQTNRNKSKQRVIREEIPEQYKIERNINNMFDESEINILKQLIQDYPELKEYINNHVSKFKNDNEISNSIIGIKAERTKQTYTINNDLINKIEKYCTNKKISKSDFINIAILKALQE